MTNIQLENNLNEYLRSYEFKDFAPNGLQVEGRPVIKKVITAVSASVELFEKAIEEKADAILVHHGIILDFERPLYRGGYKKRVKMLLENDINLFAYHLPLDAHATVGNNAQLAALLGLENVQPFGAYKGQYVGVRGTLNSQPMDKVVDIIQDKVNEKALIFNYGPREISNVGIVSGAAQKDVKDAVEQKLDLFITGEVSEHILHYVKEEEIHFIAAGHYATERYGVKALGEYLRSSYNLDVRYIEVPNPV